MDNVKHGVTKKINSKKWEDKTENLNSNQFVYCV